MKNPLKCSIGIMAYNEAKNLPVLMRALERQKLKDVVIDEILIISSGSTDNTNEVAQKAMKKNPKVQLLTESKRSGKATAINIFLESARNEILVLESADTLPDRNTIERLVVPFRQKQIGITGSHPVPVNPKNTIIGYAVNALWDLHHEISLHHPKIGETIAFRKSFKKIPVLSAVDEVNIEALLRGHGYKAVYVPDAIVRNKGPETFKEFTMQRRRIYAGHLATIREYSYTVSTISGHKIFLLMLQKSLKHAVKDVKHIPSGLFFTCTTIFLEAYSRGLGYIDFKFRHTDYSIWEIAQSTKQVTATSIQQKKKEGKFLKTESLHIQNS